ncbi:MAG TPA: GAF domain-containing protein [Pyrinomonadaceae bacterium]|nr:GAF domain-containing protein [Pyrinomonadaceae bacterium]
MNDNPQNSGSKSFAEQLSDIAASIDVSNSLTVSLQRAIDDLLRTASNAVNSAVASVLVRDGDSGGLKFLTATSGVTEELLALRLPPGAGIAGLVFSTQQPMAVADVEQEGSFWSEADKRTGFKTVTLLATPLRGENELVGVLEFVNRDGDPPYPPFTPAEMDRAARFAEPIARLVEAYEIAQLVESLFNFQIRSSLTTKSHAQRQDEEREWLATNSSVGAHRDLLTIWLSLRDIINSGDAERKLCRELLESVERFAQNRSGSAGQFGF